MPKGLWIRDRSRAIPADERSMEFLLAQKDGVPFIAETRGARNVQQLRLWWGLCRLVAGQLDVIEVVISDDLKKALGHTETIKQRDGSYKVVPKSIAFESMAQEHFNNLMTAAVNKVAEWLGSSPKEVRDRFNEMVADKRYAGMRR
jgi:hypothetical protein